MDREESHLLYKKASLSACFSAQLSTTSLSSSNALLCPATVLYLTMLSSISAALAFTALTHCCLAAPASLNNPEAVDSSLAVRQNPYCQDHQGETGRYTLILDDYVKCEVNHIFPSSQRSC